MSAGGEGAFIGVCLLPSAVTASELSNLSTSPESVLPPLSISTVYSLRNEPLWSPFQIQSDTWRFVCFHLLVLVFIVFGGKARISEGC